MIELCPSLAVHEATICNQETPAWIGVSTLQAWVTLTGTLSAIITS